MIFVFNPDAEGFVPKAEEEHRHRGERNEWVHLGVGETGHRMGKQTPRQRGRECRGWDGLGRLNPTIGNEGKHRARKQRASLHRERENTKKEKKTERSDQASVDNFASREARARGTCGGSDLQCMHAGCEREERVWPRRVRAGEGPTTWL